MKPVFDAEIVKKNDMISEHGAMCFTGKRKT